MPIYTKTGDDGTTGLLHGGRISKADPVAEAYGSIDETVAALGLARALLGAGDLHDLILRLQRELFVVAADLATNPDRRAKLEPGVSLATPEMVDALASQIRLLEAHVVKAQSDRAYLGEVAGKLRLLIVDTRSNKALLLRVADAYSARLSPASSRSRLRAPEPSSPNRGSVPPRRSRSPRRTVPFRRGSWTSAR